MAPDIVSRPVHETNFHAIVVTNSANGAIVTFYLNESKKADVTIDRKITDCQTSSDAVFIADEGISIGRMRFSQFAMNTGQVLDLYEMGRLMPEIEVKSAAW